MKILVLGAGGQVASAVVACLPPKHTVSVKSRAELNVDNDEHINSVLSTEGPDWIINGAAYTGVDRAESDAVAARSTNKTAVGTIARAAAKFGCRLVHLSTDFVFDGMANHAYRPSDSTNPLSVYGLTKREGEVEALAGGDAIVLRTSWVYAARGHNFVLTMLRMFREREEVRVVADQIGTPTWASELALTVWGLIDVSAKSGIYHWTDLGIATWYDFAVAIQEEGLARGLLSRAVPIVPITTAEYPTPARRPVFSALDSVQTRTLLNNSGHHWRQNLRKMLDELRTA